jgi:preprotein translocase subunit SecA
MGGPLGERFLSELRGQNVVTSRGRGLAAAIVDEADDVLLDDAVSPLILSGAVPGEAIDSELHHRALQLIDELQANVDYQLFTGGRVELTNSGFERVYNETEAAAHRHLLRPWHEYVVAALRAAHCYRRDVHYIVREDEIALIDGSTGRVFADRSWSGGLHQAVQAREGLTVRSESSTLARITKQRYFRSYQFLSGMTGTADQCQREFQCVYGTPVIAISSRLPSRRLIASPCVTCSIDEKHAAIIAETIAMRASNRPVLIGTHSVSESQTIAAQLNRHGLRCELLNGIQDADEASVIAQAGRADAITVATHLAGRGTDIRLDELAKARGGLHVIVSQMHAITRVDRQLIGRAARCGDPGSCRIFIATDDPLITEHAPWIARHLHRTADIASVRGDELYRQLCTIQARRQRDASAWRMRLLQSDQREQSIILRNSAKSPDACWAI